MGLTDASFGLQAMDNTRELSWTLMVPASAAAPAPVPGCVCNGLLPLRPESPFSFLFHTRGQERLTCKDVRLCRFSRLLRGHRAEGRGYANIGELPHAVDVAAKPPANVHGAGCGPSRSVPDFKSRRGLAQIRADTPESSAALIVSGFTSS